MIRILIVDDSALMRRQLAQVFEEATGFEIRLAKNGREAVEECRAFRPDVVTLDINMPEMDGITALSLIMAERPVPVVMVSSLTEKGALATFEALNLGAVDYVTKPGGTISMGLDAIRKDLLAKVYAASKVRIKPKASTGIGQRLKAEREPVVRPLAIRRGGATRDGIIIIGASTGGPRTLEEILCRLPATLSRPVLVCQHMPPAFTKSFADRLDLQCPLKVVEAASPMAVVPGTIYIAKGGADMVASRRNGELTVLPKPESSQYLWHPSVELMGRSVLETCDPAGIIAVMLTGMGYDGAESFAEIKQRGGRTIAESEDSAVVFGMPAEVIKRGGASAVLHADRIAAQIIQWSEN
jgi:two-component system, chemotaxis family, protein-glutamate methylesterase/glutaminase